VGVVLPSDAGYRRARRARQGEARLHPRLDVVLKRTREYRRFLASGNGYDAAKQRVVATLFAEALAGADLWAVFGVTGRGSRLAAAEIFVCFSDFERVARQEAHAAVTADELTRFTSSLGVADDVLWCVQRAFGPPIVFVHTDEQAAALRSAPDRDRWADEYFALVRAHDEFGYLERADVAVHVDSRQNLDENYSGNLYHYFK
jgi:hypothetical protein